MTLTKAIRSSGIKVYPLFRKNEVRPNNMILRLEFAKSHADWKEEQWGKIIFSDESDLYPFRTHRCVIRRKPDEIVIPRLENDLDTKSIKIWGYISYEGVGSIYRLDSDLNSSIYMKVLENNITPIKSIFVYGDKTFMQDNARPHVSRKIKRRKPKL